MAGGRAPRRARLGASSTRSQPYSTFTLQNQVGSVTMELLDFELRRAQHWQDRQGVSLAELAPKLLAAASERAGPTGLSVPEARLAEQLAWQEPVVHSAVSLLMAMAQEPGVQQKMLKRVRARVVLLVGVCSFSAHSPACIAPALTPERGVHPPTGLAGPPHRAVGQQQQRVSGALDDVLAQPLPSPFYPSTAVPHPSSLGACIAAACQPRNAAGDHAAPAAHSRAG